MPSIIAELGHFVEAYLQKIGLVRLSMVQQTSFSVPKHRYTQWVAVNGETLDL